MTYDAKHHSHPLINALPGAIGTHLGYASLSRGLASLRRGGMQRGAKGLLKAVRLTLRGLYRLEQRNFTLWLRRTLACSAQWRASVLADLGGERALRRWERRYRLAHGCGDAGARAGKVVPPSGQTGKQRGGSPGSNGGVKTDASGMFRLAVVKTAPQARSGRGGYSGSVRARAYFPVLRPIGLTPDELRGYGLYEGTESAGVPTDPHALWAQLLAPLEDAAAELAGLELVFNRFDVGLTPDDMASLRGPIAPLNDDAKANYCDTHPD